MTLKVDREIFSVSLADVPQAAREAEAIGFEGVVSAETAHDPFLPLALAAEHTERLRLGTSVAIAFPRSPMMAAQAAWDLQRLSGGRFVLGLGTQVKPHNLRRYSVPWSPPAPRLREYIESLRAIWHTFQTGAELSYTGEHYSFTLMRPPFNPGPIDHAAPRIQIAAVNERNARLAGEVCDGLVFHPFHTASYVREVLVPRALAGLASRGRRREDFEIGVHVLLAGGPDWSAAEQAAARIRRMISFYGSTRTYRAVFAHHGWEDATERLHAMSLRGEWEQMAGVVTDEMLDAFAVVAPYDGLAEAIRTRYEDVCDRVTISLPHTPDALDVARTVLGGLRSDAATRAQATAVSGGEG